MSLTTSHTPPTPAYIFRGHQAAIHALHFFQDNVYFASGDSDGWVVVWKVSTRRPVAVWHAHNAGVMALKDWEGTRLMSHGRDHKLCVWQLRPADFDILSIKLPIDQAAKDVQQPWLLHTMPINALNFCAFATCLDPDSIGNPQPLLLASPNGLDSGGIDIFQLPSEKRVSKIQSDKSINTGMVMSLRLCQFKNELLVMAGYEDGRVMVHKRKPEGSPPVWTWERVMSSRPHSQPVLSLDITPDCLSFITSSADANIVKFALLSDTAEKTLNSKHAGQQDLTIRLDGKIFATAGWDNNVRVYSVKSLKELALLKWHQSSCYAVAFAETLPAVEEVQTSIEDNAMVKMKQEWDTKQRSIHWLVAGSKDGKISMWDVY